MAKGIKDASDLILVSLATGEPALFIDYANATSSEWSAESVYANRKGVRAIRWDDARQGTLTLDTELFDYSLLAMVMGSDVREGKSDIFTRNEGEITADRTIKLNADGEIDEATISVIKLRPGSAEHVGLPLLNTTTAQAKFPTQVTNLVVSTNDKEAKVTFSPAQKADSYQVFRDGEMITEITSPEFSETGLTPETPYEYQVVGVNVYGRGAKSAKVEATTSADSVKEFTPHNPTSEALEEAKSYVPEISGGAAGQPTFTVENGEIVFSENVQIGDSYAVYFMEEVDNVRTLTIGSEKFPGNYEIFANATITDENGEDDVMQIHYKNAKPQSNFTLTQSASEPTSLSIVFDLFPVNKVLAEMKVIE